MSLISAPGLPTPQVPDTAAASAEAAPAKWWHVSDERILEMLQPPALAPARSVEEVMELECGTRILLGFRGQKLFFKSETET